MLPDTLRGTPQWMVSGEDKAPRSVRTGLYADVTDASNYSTYEEAFTFASNNGLDVGFALTAGDPFAVIDLDEPETEEQRVRHQQILEAFDTYAELSRSGNGVHIWCYGSIERGVRRDKVELYSADRYMICTGRNLSDRPIAARQELLTQLFEEVARGASDLAELVEEEALLSDAEVVEKGSNAVNGAKFDALCNGQWRGQYPSQSEADHALLSMLCFYSDSNEQVRRLFRMSQLGKRRKAQRDDYLNRSISKLRAEDPPSVDFSALMAAGPGSESLAGSPGADIT